MSMWTITRISANVFLLHFKTHSFVRPIRPHKYHEYVDIFLSGKRKINKMREILFRGKRKDNGKWVEGYLLQSNLIVPAGQFFNFCKCNDKNIITSDSCFVFYEIDQKTRDEYTGLTDKNGVKIFEGDILNTTNSNYAIWYIDYKNTAFCCNQGNANYSCVLDEFMQYSDIEVIGNIHDNPKLLERER